jgi:predicted methyltransferase
VTSGSGARRRERAKSAFPDRRPAVRPTLAALPLALALVFAGAAFAASANAGADKPAALPAYVQAAVADPARGKDAQIDARRKVGELVAFPEAKPGDAVLELIPGSGYFTRVFSKVVGPKGHVYGLWPRQYEQEAVSDVKQLRAMAAQPGYGNVEVLVQEANALKTPRPVDVVFTSQNYHDYNDPFMQPASVELLNRQVFAALKPGGTWVIVDHAAEAGSGMRDTDTLHRIDPAIVRKQVEAAGFVYVGESKVLRNPQDGHKVKVFDPSIRRHTDQFAYKFRKPAN